MQQADVRLLVDAEHTYFQPAIDNTVTELQRQYNRAVPRIYGTIQCYLKDSRGRLLEELERARREVCGRGWGVGVGRGWCWGVRLGLAARRAGACEARGTNRQGRGGQGRAGLAQ